MKSITIAITVFAAAALPATAADFLVNPRIICTRTSSDSSGKEKLVRENLLKNYVLQSCLDHHGGGLTSNDVELTLDSDNGILHVIRKCDGSELCDFGVSFCVQAINETSSGNTDKLTADNACVLEIFFDSPASDLFFGTAFGKEKLKSESTDGLETKLAFKASYQGQFELITFFGEGLVCTIKFATGARFAPTGGCP